MRDQADLPAYYLIRSSAAESSRNQNWRFEKKHKIGLRYVRCCDFDTFGEASPFEVSQDSYSTHPGRNKNKNRAYVYIQLE
jgi:hypothetical protein